jgi:hypothetical protein
MDENAAAAVINKEHEAAMITMVCIRTGLFDHHLTRILDEVTKRMAAPEFQHFRVPNSDPVENYRRYYLPGAHPEAAPAELDAMADQYRADLERYLAAREEAVR